MGVPESRKNAHKFCRKVCGVPMSLPGWVPYSISAFSSRQHVTQSPPGGARTQGEHVSVHRSISGPKGILALLQDLFKIKPAKNLLCEPLASRPKVRKPHFLRFVLPEPLLSLELHVRVLQVLDRIFYSLQSRCTVKASWFPKK